MQWGHLTTMYYMILPIRAFDLYGIDIETVEDELCELLYEGYLRGDNSGISLTCDKAHRHTTF